jgi:hypothetical protein
VAPLFSRWRSRPAVPASRALLLPPAAPSAPPRLGREGISAFSEPWVARGVARAGPPLPREAAAPASPPGQNNEWWGLYKYSSISNCNSRVTPYCAIEHSHTILTLRVSNTILNMSLSDSVLCVRTPDSESESPTILFPGFSKGVGGGRCCSCRVGAAPIPPISPPSRPALGGCRRRHFQLVLELSRKQQIRR